MLIKVQKLVGSLVSENRQIIKSAKRKGKTENSAVNTHL